MPAIRKIATLTFKGQVTLPESARQLLGLDTGGKIAFDVRADEIVVSRVETDHQDPAIGAFLSVLEADVRNGRNLTALPEDLAQAMLANTADTASMTQEATLHSLPEPAKPVPVDTLSVVALNMFDSFPANGTDALVAWDQIPRFSGEHLNNKEGQVPNDHSVDFQINGRHARLTLFPGTFYPTKTSKPLRRYLGVKEQLVEHALIHHAALQAQGPTVTGDASRYVTFTISALGRQLKAMGNTMSNVQIRQALDVLSSSVMTLSYGTDLTLDNRDTILSSFGRNSLSTASGNNGDDIWRVKLHPLAVQSMLSVMSGQYPIGQFKHYSPVGAALLRRVHCIAPRVSKGLPYTFTVREMRMVTAGLNHVRLAGSMQAIKRELERMQADDYLVRFTMEEIFPAVRGRGRPVPMDYRFTLYPDPQ